MTAPAKSTPLPRETDISKAPVAAGKYPLGCSEKSSLGTKGMVLSVPSALIFFIQSARKVDKQFK